jgi:hypothetical protein
MILQGNSSLYLQLLILNLRNNAHKSWEQVKWQSIKLLCAAELGFDGLRRHFVGMAPASVASDRCFFLGGDGWPHKWRFDGMAPTSTASDWWRLRLAGSGGHTSGEGKSSTLTSS